MIRPRDNRTSLVRVRVSGRISPARLHPEAMRIDREGRECVLPGTGGVALDVHAGDHVDGWLADHLMPGASIEDDGDPAVAGPLHLLACLGNAVTDGLGRPLGVVAGKRGGLAPGFWAPQLVGVELSVQGEARAVPGDRVVLEAHGRGLTLSDLPEVALANLSPRALDALPLRQEHGVIVCAAAAILPPEVAGAGLGQDTWIGDLEIAGTGVRQSTLNTLHFGDLVVFADTDARTTRHYRRGFLAIGVVSHGGSQSPGHGIGVTILMSGPAAVLQAEIRAGAGLGSDLRAWAEPSSPAEVRAVSQSF